MSKHFPQYYLIWGKQNFCYNIRNFKEAGTAAYVLKNYQNGKKATVFLKVFMSHLGFIFHFNFQFDRSHFSVWNIRFHIAFNTFFSFHKLQLCSLIGKFWYIYVIRIKTNKSPRLMIFHWTSWPPPSLTPPPFIQNLRVCVHSNNSFFSLLWMKHFVTLI